jgi:HK97 family phage portal protein
MLQRIKEWMAQRRRDRAMTTWRETNTWLHDWVSQASASWSGESVNARSAMTVGEYYAACRNIAEDIAKLPLHVYRRLEPRGKERLNAHPVQKILDRPNPEMTAMAFRETLIAHALTWGKGLAEIQRDVAGRPARLWPMDPARTEIKRDDAKDLVYVVWGDDGTSSTLRDADVFHVHGLGYDGTTGYSVATVARQYLGLSLAQLRHGASLFKNGARPNGVIEYPGTFSDEDAMRRFLRIWNEYHGGAANAGKVGILEDGMKWAGTSIPNTDAQWIESRGMSVEDVARILRIPPHKIGHLDKATFSNIESQAREYVTDTLLSWETRVEQEVGRKLIQQTSIFAEHVNAALLKGETTGRFAAYATARQWGWMSANDVRDFENMNGIGQAGDIYLTPSNMVDAETLLEPPEPEPPPLSPTSDDDDDAVDEPDAETMSVIKADVIRDVLRRRNGDRSAGLADVFRPALADIFDRCLRVAGDRVLRKAAGLDIPTKDPNPALGLWAECWLESQYETLAKMIHPIIMQYVGATWAANGGEVLPVALDLAATQHADLVVDRYVQATINDIRERGAEAPAHWATERRADADAAFEANELVELLKGTIDA